ncbi:hypothetical protein EON65_39150 [archaeon]|nr:MAG: hypothetical protein EON65_39150 [archaeon]
MLSTNAYASTRECFNVITSYPSSNPLPRYFDEVMLDCCDPLDKVTKEGIGLRKVACLALCNGAKVFMCFNMCTFCTIIISLA